MREEENYVAQTFERFWQATALTQHIKFNSLAGALQYLHACLNGAMIDTLRATQGQKKFLYRILVSQKNCKLKTILRVMMFGIT